MNPVILELRNIQIKRGGMLVIDLPALSIETGEFLSLIGPNGTGKSTLLLALSCLLKPVRGSLLFHGREVRDNQAVIDYRRHIAMVFQEPLLFDTTVFDNVASGLKIRGISKKERTPLVEEYLERFGISHLAQRSARKLSGGEAQRTSLARAFATKPEVIFLDEPFSSLDPPTREGLINDLDLILKETRTTALMATHDQSEALRLSERIAVMKEGKIIQIGTPTQVMNHPADEFVASFVGVETILSGTVKENREGIIVVDIGGHTFEALGELRPGTGVTCCIRPEHITLARFPADSGSSARNALTGKIENIQPMGLFYKIQLDCGFYLVAYITRTSLEELSLKTGDQVIATFKATAVHVIRATA
ncbi:MAG TPA: ABC transporter ATP-binding protein [Syntrophales bacterium]|jgi:tungstate transport system ATP-binding protein|nr:ABC transporter ATP-binding protein [Syntrophales bacterium]HPX56358.1 ABC transporter ATP-binding protein [Syntrophales bacterium]HQA82659.1 ABC transporter ATP-binding protein [Syntrophales bacterium]